MKPSAFVAALALILTTTAHANRDRVPMPIAIDKTYLVEKPIGKLRIVYECSPESGDATLRVESVSFRGTVSADALAALPGADWDRMVVSYFVGSRTDDPAKPLPAYVSLRVPLRGPPGAQWRDTTSVAFLFRAGGIVDRKLDRVADGRSTYADWPLDSARSASDVLGEPRPSTRPASP